MEDKTMSDVQQLLDSVRPSCEWRTSGIQCVEDAAWIMQVSCGELALFCGGHRHALDGDLGAGGETLHCAIHGGMRVYYEWVSL